MSTTVRAAEYAAQAQRLASQYQSTLQKIDAAKQENQQHSAELRDRRQTALSELCAALLPDLRPETLTKAMERTGYAALVHENPVAAVQAKQQELLQRIASLEADPRYQNRLILRAPRVGMLVRDLAELEEYRQPLVAFLEKCQHPRMEHLIAVGYDTDRYSVGFWRYSYYQDWEAGDEIRERFGNQKTFAAIAEEFRQATTALPTYEVRIGKLRSEIQAGENLEREIESLRAEVNTVEARTLEEWRGRLASHLHDLDASALGDRMTGVPEVEVLAKRYFGLSKQVQYLDEASQHMLESSRASVAAAIAQLERDATKYSSAKRASEQLPVERLHALDERNQRYLRQVDRYRDVDQSVIRYNGYSQARLDDDYLWWDAMVHGRHAGDFITDVAHYRSHYPDAHARRQRELERQLAEQRDLLEQERRDRMHAQADLAAVAAARTARSAAYSRDIS